MSTGLPAPPPPLPSLTPRPAPPRGGRSADDVVAFYRLKERLGKGGFAEVWRARPEPSRALAAAPAHQVQRAVAALASILEGREGPAPVVTRNLAESLAALERVATGRPAGVLEEHLEAAQRVFAWADELAAGGALDVALKVPFHDGYVRQMRREKDILHRVAHPRLVRQFQLDVEHDPPFMAMELVAGWSLRDALKEEPMPHMAKLLSIMDQLLTALDYLHRRGLVHGDVKPENVMVEPTGALRLIDLGLGSISQAVMRDTYLSLSLASRVPLLGTLSYMAPEVRKGAPASPASDLFSAGIILYEMLVGDVPHGMTLPTEAATDRAALSTRFDVLLKWVLHPDPTKRVPSARELRERVLLTLKERPKHQLGAGRGGTAREGTQDFDRWALENASPFVAGDWVGPYQLEEPLGRGGFGEVWRARQGGQDEGDDERDESETPDVALKLAIGPGGKDGLAREAEVAARLDHPRIPAVHEVRLEHDPPYLAVDYVRGRSLRARLTEDGPLDVATAMLALGGLADALAHCHARGVVHQDLKPENLLFDEREAALFLLDFGLASVPQDRRPTVEVSKHLATREQEGGGTFEYMPPERRRGEPGGPASDAYALGVILFESLTGELPRGLTTLRELCPLAPLGLEGLCAQLLDPQPERRPALPLVSTRLGADAPRRAEPAGRVVRRGPRRGSERLVLGGALAIVVAVLAWAAFTHRAVEPTAPQPTTAGRPDPARRERLLGQAEAAAALPLHELEGLAAALEALDREEPRPRVALASARVAALVARRARADELLDRGRWRLAQARTERERWTRDASAGPREASEGVAHAAQAVELLGGGVTADPAGPQTPDGRVELNAARALLAGWRADLAARGAVRLKELGRRPDVAAALALELELVAPGAPDASGVDPRAWGAWRAPLDRRLLAEALEARDLEAARAALVRLDAAARSSGRALEELVSPADRAHVRELAAQQAQAAALLATALAPGAELELVCRTLERVERALPAPRRPGRALARAQAARQARDVQPQARLAQARAHLVASRVDAALGVLDVARRDDPSGAADLVAVALAFAGDAAGPRPGEVGADVGALLGEHASLERAARRAREHALTLEAGDDAAALEVWRDVAAREQAADRLAWRLVLAVTPR